MAGHGVFRARPVPRPAGWRDGQPASQPASQRRGARGLGLWLWAPQQRRRSSSARRL